MTTATATKLPAYNVTQIAADKFHYEGRIYRSQKEIWQVRQKQISEMNRYRGASN